MDFGKRDTLLFTVRDNVDKEKIPALTIKLTDHCKASLSIHMEKALYKCTAFPITLLILILLLMY